MKSFEAVVQTDPETALAWWGLGEARAAGGDLAGAINAYERVLKLQPSATHIHALLATTYGALGRKEVAEKHVALRGEGAVEYEDPWMLAVVAERRGVNSSLTAGTKAFRKGDYQQAVVHFREATTLDSHRANAWLNLGASLVELGESEEAARAMEESIRLDPSQAKAYFNLGTLHSSQGKTLEAIEHLTKALEIDAEYSFRGGQSRERLSSNWRLCGVREGVLRRC